MKKETKKDKIIKFLLDNGNILNKQNIDKILSIDKNFDFNLFKNEKTPISVLFFDKETEERLKGYNKGMDVLSRIKNLNLNNSRSFGIRFPFKFKRKTDSKIQSDMNIFFREIKDVIFIQEEEEKIRWDYSLGWANAKKHVIKKPYYHVIYDDNKKNKKLKTFRFILHSISKKASNIADGKYFINGLEISESEFKKISRNEKFKKILDENLF